MAYNFKKIEKKWSDKWLKDKTYEPDLNKAKKPFYNLMMFPYPSAEGLHVGNMYAFTGSDIYGRYQRMKGNDVLEPMGLDGFGIHSENYAMKIGTHPMKQAQKSEKNFYRQLMSLGNGFAWQEKVETYDPDYYKWTQWLFLIMFKNGLAYRKKATVNWCPSCKTVLADEQVEKGKCERCGTEVIKKDLEQWFFKITDYAERLLNNLAKLDWSERVKIAQENWIGKSEGAEIDFSIKGDGPKISIFTTRPDTLFGATYLVLAPENKIIDALRSKIKNLSEVESYIKESSAKPDIERTAEGIEKTGVRLEGVFAINPANGEEIPVYIADYVLSGYGTGAVMAVPAHDERDFEFAKKFNLPMKMVVCPHYPAATCPILDRAYTGSGHLVDSGKFNGIKAEEAGREITNFVKGKSVTKYRLRDWLISRQRYWGPPIPIIYCKHCWEKTPLAMRVKLKYGVDYSTLNGEEFIIHSVPLEDLPVKLPYVKNFRPIGSDKSPLTAEPKFYKVPCPKCKKLAQRETDVSDTFLDSSWYFLRYPDNKNKKKPFDKQRVKKWLPVDMYIGGAEHSVLHLLYSRFMTMVLSDLKYLDFEEPFKKFRAHGLLIKEGMKMSKSKGNVINPDEYIKKFGADVLRMYLMFLGPFEQGGDWRDEGIMGLVRFINRVWSMGTETAKLPESKESSVPEWMYSSIEKITKDIESLEYNTCISELMIVSKKLESEPSRGGFEAFIKMLAPFAPYISEELWSLIGVKTSIHHSSWPEFEGKVVKAKEFDLIIQVNGKFRAKVKVPANIVEAEAKEIALKDPLVQNHIKGQNIAKTIFVPGRLINIVTN